MRCEEAGPLLEDYREQRLERGEQAELERHLQQCESCAGCLATLETLAGEARAWREAEAPAWHRTAFAVPARGAREWLPWLSLATSALCVVLLLTGVDVRSDAGGFRVRFGAARVDPGAGLGAAALEERLALFEEQQRLSIANRLTAWDIERQQDNRKMMSAMLEQARGQQRQDLVKWLGYWKAVRDNDQALQARAFDELLDSQQQSSRELRALRASLQYPTGEDI